MSRERSNAKCDACKGNGCPACRHSGERPAVPQGGGQAVPTHGATFHGPTFDPLPPGHLSWVDAYSKVCEERDALRAEVERQATRLRDLEAFMHPKGGSDER